jgi:HEAT repeat protein
MAAEAEWKEFLPLMVTALKHPAATPHWGPRYGLLRVIGRLGHGDKAAAEAIQNVLNDRYMDEHGDAKAVAALAAGRIGDPALIPVLRRYVDSSYAPLKHHAALSLSVLGDPELAPTMREWLRLVGDENYRGVAAEALGNLRDRDSVGTLTAAAAVEPFPWVREKINESLERITEGNGHERETAPAGDGG